MTKPESLANTCASHTPHPASEIDLDHEFADGFAHRFIRFKVRQILGRCGIARDDRDDLEQTLKLCLFRRFPEFDPASSDWPAFVTTVVERQIATILQARKRKKRLGAGLHVSLSDETRDEDGLRVELADCVAPDQIGNWTRVFDRSDIDWSDLEHDLSQVVSQLPHDMQDLCERLKHGSVSSVAREMNMPRSTLVTLLKRLRPAFDAEDFSTFL